LRGGGRNAKKVGNATLYYHSSREHSFLCSEDQNSRYKNKETNSPTLVEGVTFIVCFVQILESARAQGDIRRIGVCI